MLMTIFGIARNSARGGQRDVFHVTPENIQEDRIPTCLALADRMNRALVAGDHADGRLTSIQTSTEGIAKSGDPRRTPAALGHRDFGDEVNQNRYEPMSPR
jgi:hypothetical protein